MYVFLSILILICALLLIGVILIQKSKGGGLASNFQGANQIMGVRSATNFVEKATWTLAIIICLLSIISAFLAPKTIVKDKSELVFDTKASSEKENKANNTTSTTDVSNQNKSKGTAPAKNNGNTAPAKNNGNTAPAKNDGNTAPAGKAETPAAK